MTDVLVLTRYEGLGASSRIRFLRYFPTLEQQGFMFDVRPLLDNAYGTSLYGGPDRRGQYPAVLFASLQSAQTAYALRPDLAREGSATLAPDLAGNRAA